MSQEESFGSRDRESQGMGEELGMMKGLLRKPSVADWHKTNSYMRMAATLSPPARGRAKIPALRNTKKKDEPLSKATPGGVCNSKR